MYMAKRDSKGSYRIFEPAMHERVVERLELRAELQRAIELNQLEVHYQPVVRLETARSTASRRCFAGSIRRAGRSHPLSFIPLAEETGLIIPDRPLGPAGGVPAGCRSCTSGSLGRPR